MTNQPYTIEFATEFGLGGGPNGTGKRAKKSGFYLISPQGRRVHAWTINSKITKEICETQAQAHANKLNEHYGLGR